jgi:hypothetical protein
VGSIEALPESEEFKAEKRAAATRTLELRTGQAAVGDVYSFCDAPEQEGFEWVLISEHPDQAGCFFCIPADRSMLVGSMTTFVPAEHLFGPLSLHCGFGIWIDGSSCERGVRTGVVEDDYTAAGRAVVRAMIIGADEEPSDRQLTVDDSPLFRLQENRAGRASAALESFLMKS